MTARKLGIPVLITMVIGIFMNVLPVTAGSQEATFDRLKALEGEWERGDNPCLSLLCTVDCYTSTLCTSCT